MKCPHCGAIIKETDAFCYQCGKALEPNEVASYPQSTPMTKTPSSQTYPNEIEEFRYAGFWKRFAAWIIDFIVLSVFSIPISLGMYFIPDPWSTFIAWPVSLLIGVLYYSLQESSIHQATLGKRALGIIVTDMEGNRISFGRAAGRELAKYLSALILFIGFLIIGFTEKKQGLHDMIAGCLVINK